MPFHLLTLNKSEPSNLDGSDAMNVFLLDPTEADSSALDLDLLNFHIQNIADF